MRSIKTLTILFSIFVLIELLSEVVVQNYPMIRYWTKPIPILLLIAALLKVRRPKFSNWYLIGLVGSLLGDISLLFQNETPILFIIGLLFFLSAHILYITSFQTILNDSILPLFKSIPTLFFSGMFLLYAIVFYYTIYPTLGDMKIPVAIYIIVILSMLIRAYLLNVQLHKANLIFFGAVFFVISDSILAFNKFFLPIPHASLLIMGTYYLAQILIFLGITRFLTNPK